jgi:hypothetical protein
MANKTKVKTPHGIVVIYNYRERFGDSYLPDDPEDLDKTEPPYDIDQIILNSASLMSITTQKSKGSPNGAFEIKLAPYKNWTSAITPGSWCVILMSNYPINDAAKYGDATYGSATVQQKSFKMLGRIESVRGVVSTNPADGSITKHYIVTGSDWGCVFNSSLYVDPLSRDPDATAIGLAQRWGYGDYLLQALNWKKSQTKTTSKQEPKTNDKSTSQALTDLGDVKTILSGKASAAKAAEQAQLTALQNEEKKENPAFKQSFRPTSVTNIKSLIELWGNTGDASTTNDSTGGKLLGDAQHVFKIPKRLKQYMKFDTVEISGLIQCEKYSGKLTGKDTYNGDSYDIGLIRFDSIFGEHSVWQVLSENYNELTSELIADVRFTGDKPELVLYNRIKPFTVSPTVDKIIKDRYYIEGGSPNEAGTQSVAQPKNITDIIEKNFSKFSDVRCITLDSADVIMSSFGTNWRDKINFVEVSIDKSLLFGEAYSASIKLQSQFYDKKSISRDGLRSMRQSTSYVPSTADGLANPTSSFAYKFLLKEWFFNTHTMLNGTLALAGQDQYIQVGDNIKVSAKVLDINRNFSQRQKDFPADQEVFLLAHVESISHNISVENYSRVFHTTINFVRGILVDKNLNPINTFNKGVLDQDAKLLTPAEEVNNRMSGSSSLTDPDRQKLGFGDEGKGTASPIDQASESKEDGSEDS